MPGLECIALDVQADLDWGLLSSSLNACNVYSDNPRFPVVAGNGITGCIFELDNISSVAGKSGNKPIA